MTEYYRLIGFEPKLDQEDEDFFEGRRSLESYMAHKLRVRCKLEPNRFNHRYFDDEYPFLAAEIDAETDDESIEFKTSSEFLAKKFGDEDSDDYPVAYATQVIWGLGMRPKKRARLMVCLGFDRDKCFQIEPEPELFRDMKERVLSFMYDHVAKRIPPDPISLDDAKIRWPTSIDRSILVTDQILDHLKAMAKIKDEAKVLDSILNNHYLEVVKFLGDNEAALLDNGKLAVTYRSPAESTKINHEGIADAYAEVLEEIANKKGCDPELRESIILTIQSTPKLHIRSVTNSRRLLIKIKA